MLIEKHATGMCCLKNVNVKLCLPNYVPQLEGTCGNTSLMLGVNVGEQLAPCPSCYFYGKAPVSNGQEVG
jgi:hypothetical protein